MSTRPRGHAWPLLAVLLLAPGASAAETRVAGVDVGSKGIRGVVIAYDPDIPSAPVKVLFAKSTNPANGVLRNGMLVPAIVANTADDLAEFVRIFTTEYQVPANRIQIVGSSSLGALADRDTLAQAVEKKTQLRMTFLANPDEEVQHTIHGLAVLGNRPPGLLLDFGSGNAKGGAPAPSGLQTFGVPYGTVTLATKVRDLRIQKKLTFRDAITELRDAQLLPAVRAALSGKPALTSQSSVAVTGGIVYATATLIHPERATEPTVPLTLADFRALVAMLGKDPLQFPEVETKSIADPKVRAKAEADIAHVRTLFTPENLLAGATVVLTVGAELKLEGKELRFLRDAKPGTQSQTATGAQFAWIIGKLVPSPQTPTPPVPTPNPPTTPNQVATPVLPPEPVPLGVPYIYAPGTPTGYYPLAVARPYAYLSYYPTYAPPLNGWYPSSAPAVIYSPTYLPRVAGDSPRR